MAVPVIHNEDVEFEIGKGIVLKEGKDATIIAIGFMVHLAMEAADILKNENIDAEVIDMHTIKSIDKDLIIKSAIKTKAVVTAEELNIIGGLGSAVAEVLSEECPTPMVRVGIGDVFGQSGKPADLVEFYKITAKDIVDAVMKLM